VLGHEQLEWLEDDLKALQQHADRAVCARSFGPFFKVWFGEQDSEQPWLPQRLARDGAQWAYPLDHPKSRGQTSRFIRPCTAFRNHTGRRAKNLG